jgi:branched-chain amino acid transport system permease protein
LYAVATIGLGELARVLVINSATFGGALGYKNVQLVPVTQNLFWLSMALAGCALLFLLFERTHARKAFTLIQEDEVLASSLGVNVARHRLMTIAGGGILAGIAGGFYVHGVGILEPRVFGFEQSLLILVYPVFGGRRNFAGPLVGAALLTVIPEAFRFSTSLRMILYGLVLVLVVVFRPGGIVRERSNEI